MNINTYSILEVMNDSTKEIKDKQTEILLNMDPIKRFKIGAEFIDMGMRITMNRIAQEYPDASVAERKQFFIRQAYGITIEKR